MKRAFKAAAVILIFMMVLTACSSESDEVKQARGIQIYILDGVEDIAASSEYLSSAEKQEFKDEVENIRKRLKETKDLDELEDIAEDTGMALFTALFFSDSEDKIVSLIEKAADKYPLYADIVMNL